MKLLDQIEQEARELPVDEQVELLERLGQLVPVPEGEEADSVQEALRRKKELEDDPSIGLTWDQIKTSLGRGE